MKRPQLNFLIDTLAFAGFVFLTTTGVLMYFILPPGSGHHSLVMGMDRHAWGTLHFWISVGFFCVLALHTLLHWRWIVGVVRGRPREGSGLRLALGMVGLVVILSLSIVPLLLPVETGREGMASGDSGTRQTVQGSMTLEEASVVSGVPAQYLIEQLGLPADTPRDERLGRLKRQHGFEMSELRAHIRGYDSDL